MTVRIRIPSNLRTLTEQQPQIVVSAETVGDALQALISSFPMLEEKLLSQAGELHSHLNVFVGEQNIRDLLGLNTPISAGQTLLIVPALAGG